MNDQIQVSPFRLRIGVALIFLWWLPFWALSPAIADALGLSTSLVTVVIMIIQTIIGLLGIVVAGKQVSAIIKHTPFKKVPKTVWFVLISGKLA